MSTRFTAACVQTNSGTEVEPNLKAAGTLSMTAPAWARARYR